MQLIRTGIISLVALLSSVIALSGEVTNTFKFVTRKPGSETLVPIKAAHLSDANVGITVEGAGAADGDHQVHLSIYDGNGREYIQIVRTVRARGQHWYFCFLHGYDKGIDSPGTWTYVVDLDGKLLISETLSVVP